MIEQVLTIVDTCKIKYNRIMEIWIAVFGIVFTSFLMGYCIGFNHGSEAMKSDILDFLKKKKDEEETSVKNV